MTRFRLVSVTLALLLAGPAFAWAQSLGEVAKREEEKQEKKKKKSGKPPATVKVYTDEDLKKAREAESGAVTVLPENGNLEAAAAASSDDDEVVSGEGGPVRRKGKEAYWRNRATQVREAAQEADNKVKELEARIAALRNDMSPTNVMDPNRLQSRDRELRAAMDSLDATRSAAETARKALADLEEEARRAGVPPGWVR
jgi:DNA repair exonuclease SbcCD ATPase subunit